MIVDFEGRRWTLETARIGYKHAMGIQSHTGMAIGDWQDTVTGFADDGQGGVKVELKAAWLPAIGALYWLMRMQNGDPVPFDDLDFEVTPFYNAFLDGLGAEIQKLLDQAKAAKEAEAGPTPPPAPSPPGAPPSMAPSPPKPRKTVPAENAEKEGGTGS